MKGLSKLSSVENVFIQAASVYQKALKDSNNNNNSNNNNSNNNNSNNNNNKVKFSSNDKIIIIIMIIIITIIQGQANSDRETSYGSIHLLVKT